MTGGEVESAILRNLLGHTTRAYEEQVRALSREKELAQVTLASIGDGVITTDSAGRVRFLNPVAEVLTGWSAVAAASRPLAEVFPLVDEVSGLAAPVDVAQALDRGQPHDPERRMILLRPDGQRFAVEHSAAPIRGGDGPTIGLVIVFQDVTDHRLLALQLAHQATHDPLTGLLNRQAFDDHLQALLSGGAGSESHHCLLYMDVDQFKLVNDTCGHLAGDELLRRIAILLVEEVRDGDQVARLGGDEFGVLLPGCPLGPGRRIAERIHRAIHASRFAWQEKSFGVGVSIGLVPIEPAADSLAQVLSAADHACYVAKEKGRDRIQLYQRDDAEVIRRTDEMNWVVRIHKTLEEGRFRLYAQPIRKLPVGAPEPQFFEVLLRMVDEDGEVLAPTPFVRAAERYGLMRDIDRWVVERVLELLEAQPASYLAGLGTCAVNLSAVSVSDESFLEFVRAELETRSVPPEKLCFEITETAAVGNPAQAQRLIGVLSDLGCRFALDDFGSGMASYAKLKALRVSFLKIDGAFVRDLNHNPLDRAMVESINQMAHVLGIETVAEGVSGASLLERLEALGVDYAQGFGVELPRPLEQMLVTAPSPTPRQRSRLGAASSRP
ncbi:MAG TPA: EAL domain-containing protein [Thermoanaerobaculia bacterium]|nr:EAL domain-containing protein [Thermoanaerobaculia bacterium]